MSITPEALAVADVAARRLADHLGEIVGDSVSVDDAGRGVAVAFDVRPADEEEEPSTEDEGLSTIVACAVGADDVLVLHVVRARAFTGMQLAKTIAVSSPGPLAEGAPLVVSHGEVEYTVCLARDEELEALSGAGRVLIATLDPALEPVLEPSGERPGLAKLARSLERLERFLALDAPDELLDDERSLARRTHAELVAEGWDPSQEPLPEKLRAIFVATCRER